MKMYMEIFLLKFFDVSKYDFLVEGAYVPGSRIEFPPRYIASLDRASNQVLYTNCGLDSKWHHGMRHLSHDDSIC
jgi:hypothetical protein